MAWCHRTMLAYWKFESISLQRGVCKLSVPRALRLRWRNQIHRTRVREVRIQFPPPGSPQTSVSLRDDESRNFKPPSDESAAGSSVRSVNTTAGGAGMCQGKQQQNVIHI